MTYVAVANNWTTSLAWPEHTQKSNRPLVSLWTFEGCPRGEETYLVFFTNSQSLSLMPSSCLGGSDSLPIIKALNLHHCWMSDRQEQTNKSEIETKGKWADYDAEIARDDC